MESTAKQRKKNTIINNVWSYKHIVGVERCTDVGCFVASKTNRALVGGVYVERYLIPASVATCQQSCNQTHDHRLVQLHNWKTVLPREVVGVDGGGRSSVLIGQPCALFVWERKKRRVGLIDCAFTFLLDCMICFDGVQ